MDKRDVITDEDAAGLWLAEQMLKLCEHAEDRDGEIDPADVRYALSFYAHLRDDG